MEILFVIICIAIALIMPFSTSWIRKVRTAVIISRLYSVIAYMLFIAAIVLFAVTEKSSYSFYKICGMCSGSGIAASETQCAVCLGAGEILASHTSYSIPWLYPICFAALGFYLTIFSLALKILTEYSGANNRNYASK